MYENFKQSGLFIDYRKSMFNSSAVIQTSFLLVLLAVIDINQVYKVKNQTKNLSHCILYSTADFLNTRFFFAGFSIDKVY